MVLAGIALAIALVLSAQDSPSGESAQDAPEAGREQALW